MAVRINEKCIYYNRCVYTPSKTAEEYYNYLQWTGHFICEKDFYIEREKLENFLLLQTISGNGILNYKDEEILLSEHSFFLIDCSEPHTYYPKTENWEFRFIHFSGKESISLYKHIIALNQGYNFKTNSKIDRCISDCLSFENAEETLTKEARISQTINALLYEIIHSLKENKELGEVCAYIEENCHLQLSTTTISKKFGFSRSYFSTEFKKKTGTTLHDYIISSRINLSKKLISGSSLSIAQIAEKVGFCDVGTFIRAFKRKEKMTPHQFKNKGY